jgi:8-amino-7-oxononanoate synthase
MHDFEESWRVCLDDLDRAGRKRALRQIEPLGGRNVRVSDRELVDFSSNDYLGLARHPLLIERSRDYVRRFGAGSGASRLVTGNLAVHSAIEAKLAIAKGAESTLLLASGFQANATLLPALLDSKVLGAEPLVFADRLIHASLIHGCKAAGARLQRFRHNDFDHLESLLAKNDVRGRTVFIVTETVFSMDGDRADLVRLRELSERYGAFLYLDEAHATGMFGEHGFGLACGLAGPRCLVMGTFGKALGGFGAYAACSALLRDYLINRCGGLIYATALPPAVLGAIDAAIELLPSLAAERAHVLAYARTFRSALSRAGLDTGASDTQIVPVILGDERRTLDMAAQVEEDGLLGIAIRPPTVPAGTSRIRFAFSAAHRPNDIERLIESVLRHHRKVA